MGGCGGIHKQTQNLSLFQILYVSSYLYHNVSLSLQDFFFLQSCQNYIINYGTPANIVFGTISFRKNLFDTVSTEGNFLSGWHHSTLPCLQ